MLHNGLEIQKKIYIKDNLKKLRFSEYENIFGPHKTIIEILNRKNNKNVNYASTGEQKLLLISIILSHARMLNKNFNMAPILLLDDIVEHLDKNIDVRCFQRYLGMKVSHGLLVQVKKLLQITQL